MLTQFKHDFKYRYKYMLDEILGWFRCPCIPGKIFINMCSHYLASCVIKAAHISKNSIVWWPVIEPSSTYKINIYYRFQSIHIYLNKDTSDKIQSFNNNKKFYCLPVLFWVSCSHPSWSSTLWRAWDWHVPFPSGQGHPRLSSWSQEGRTCNQPKKC